MATNRQTAHFLTDGNRCLSLTDARAGVARYALGMADTSTPPGAMTSPATARNREPILEALRAHLPARGRVLEIAAGAGEHAVFLANALPGLDWTPSDPDADARASIEAWREASGAPNLNLPLAIDMLDEATWPQDRFQAVVCINMIHISPWAATEGLMRLAGRALTYPGGLLATYGPYVQEGVRLAPSNAAFDESLKARNPEWGLRSVEAVEAVAKAEGLALTLIKPMPANNLTLLFRRV